MNKIFYTIIIMFVSSVSVFAQGGGTLSGCSRPTNIPTLFSFFGCVLNSYIIPLLISLALVMFLAGIVKYVASGDSEEKRDAGKGLMLFGIIALFVMVSVWGFVNILLNTFFAGTDITSFPASSTSPFK